MVVAKHKASGDEVHFTNVRDREEYITTEIRDAWIFFFRAPNGYEWGHE